MTSFAWITWITVALVAAGCVASDGGGNGFAVQETERPTESPTDDTPRVANYPRLLTFEEQGEAVFNSAIGGLFNECAPVDVLVDVSPPDFAAEGGLMEDRIWTAAENRLRVARLHDPDSYMIDGSPNANLTVSVLVSGPAVSVDTVYRKVLFDPVFQAEYYATTWEGLSNSEIWWHRDDADYVLYLVGEFVDEFIDQYLLANEEACE